MDELDSVTVQPPPLAPPRPKWANSAAVLLPVVTEMFGQMDTDHSGTVSFEEIEVWWLHHQRLENGVNTFAILKEVFDEEQGGEFTLDRATFELVLHMVLEREFVEVDGGQAFVHRVSGERRSKLPELEEWIAERLDPDRSPPPTPPQSPPPSPRASEAGEHTFEL